MAEVLLYAHDPGGANALSPLVGELKSRGHGVVVYGSGPALDFLPGARRCVVSARELIDEVSPDFLFTGTSAADAVEKDLRVCARTRKIPSVAVLDHWVNYGVRFSHYTTAESERYLVDRVFDRLPDYIVVMDQMAKTEMVKEGVSGEMIYVLGNPHFDVLNADFSSLSVDSLRNELLAGAKKLVVFASEPYTEDYGQGYELEALRTVLRILPKDVRLVVKPHPREQVDKFKGTGAFVLPRSVSALQAVKASDVVVSMTSMVLIEAMICGRKAVSYQPGAHSADAFVLTKSGALPFIRDADGLRNYLFSVLDEKFSQKKFLPHQGSAKRIIDFMEKKLCRV